MPLHRTIRQKILQNKLCKGLAVGVGTVLLSGALIYQELKKLEGQIGLQTGVVETEKKDKAYIYVSDNGIEYNRKDRMRKWKPPVAPDWLPWLQSRSHDPKTLIHLTRSEDHNVRLLGVRALADDHNWSESEIRLVAQAIDNRTRVGLARIKHAEQKFFLPQPKLEATNLSLEDQLRNLLGSLPNDGIDKCTLFFTSNALKEGKPSSNKEKVGVGVWTFDDHGFLHSGNVDISHIKRQEMFGLQSLLGYSQLPAHCPAILRLGGLETLQRIYESRPRSIKVLRHIARILGNMSVYERLHDDIMNAGWITVLSKWIRSPDLALSLHAAKALANLDKDFGRRKYLDGVYLYHPQFRYSEPQYADVVFIHGLLGGPFRTWRQRDPLKPIKREIERQQYTQPGQPSGSQSDKQTNGAQSNTGVVAFIKRLFGRGDASCEGNNRSWMSKEIRTPYTFCWPRDWLARDCPHIRILTVEYETYLSEWAPQCPFENEKRSLRKRAGELLMKLRTAGLGDRPVVWVGHSMGGLLIKEMLTMAREDPRYEQIVDKSKGIVFYSVPHHGSPLAAYGNKTKYLMYPSVEVKELKQGSEHLETLHDKFKSLMFDTGIPLLSFAEGQKTDLPLNLKVMIVPRESSDPGFGEFYMMNDLNHLNICKPESRNSPVYQLTLDFIRDCIPQHIVDHILKANLPDDFMLPLVPGELET